MARGPDRRGFAPDGRNHYDRFVHFCYGLLMLPVAWDLFAERASPRGLWRWLMPPLFVMSHSVIYELVEWLAAETFGGDLGMAYLGTQGDIWDAQKDMALAATGAVVGTILMAAARPAARPPWAFSPRFRDASPHSRAAWPRGFPNSVNCVAFARARGPLALRGKT